jgi:hypothetical protein
MKRQVTTGRKKPIPKGKKGKGLAKLKKVAPQVVAKMGFKKKGGLVKGIKSIRKRSEGSPKQGEKYYGDDDFSKSLEKLDKNIQEFLKEYAPGIHRFREDMREKERGVRPKPKSKPKPKSNGRTCKV